MHQDTVTGNTTIEAQLRALFNNDDAVLLSYFRGKRLTALEPRLKPGGKHELATADLREADPSIRQRVFEMQKRAFEADNEAAEGGWLVSDRQAKLGEVRSPTLLVVGELDQPDFLAIGRRMAESIPDARLKVMPDVAHLPPMEAPQAFGRLVLDFLSG